MRNYSDRTEFRQIFNEAIDRASSVCIFGHISPDGDCLGSALSVSRYIENRKSSAGLPSDEKNSAEKDPAEKIDENNREAADIRVYLEEASEKFAYLCGFDRICHEPDEKRSCDLAIVLDCGDTSRLGKFLPMLKKAGRTLCVDHHVTNEGFAEESLIVPQASSTSELVYDLFDESYIDRETAEAVYTGLVHDTGVFRYSCTSPHTMEVAGRCMAKGIDFGEIIDDSFFSMTKNQKEALGRVLSEMETALCGKLVIGHIDAAAMDLYGVTKKEMDGFIDQLRTTRGALGAVFMYQCKNRTYKVSLRSNTDELNVAEVAALFGGGGHVRAAGCFMGPDLRGNIEKLVKEIGARLGHE